MWPSFFLNNVLFVFERAQVGTGNKERGNSEVGSLRWQQQARHGAQTHKPRDRDLAEVDAQPTKPPRGLSFHVAIYKKYLVYIRTAKTHFEIFIF